MQSAEQTPDTGAGGDAITEGGSRMWMNSDFASFVTSPPLLSVTGSAPTYQPRTAYRWHARAPLPVELSPKCEAHVTASRAASLACHAKSSDVAVSTAPELPS